MANDLRVFYASTLFNVAGITLLQVGGDDAMSAEEILDAIERSGAMCSEQKRRFMVEANVVSPKGNGDRETQVEALDAVSKRLFKEQRGSPIGDEFEMSPDRM